MANYHFGVVIQALCCVLVLLITHGRLTSGFECFSCENVHNMSTCHKTIYCKSDEYCAMRSTTNQSHILYTMGCEKIASCSGTQSPMMGRRAVDQAGHCHQCCADDYCNKKLCIFNTVPQVGTCHDDPSYNCALISTTFDICSDINHAKVVCRKHCKLCDLVDGKWSGWSAWSNCDQSCGYGGMMLRMRSCNNPAPAHGGSDCPGQMMQTSNCTKGPCPVNGGWSDWAKWSACDTTCDMGHRVRVRFCNNPTPLHGGLVCPHGTMETQNCTLGPCPVDGQWSDWAAWSACDRTCEHSQRLRIRTCTHPAPAHGGKDCVGNQMGVDVCTNIPAHCPIDGSWARWGDWTSCSTTCGAGLHARFRNCSNPIPKYNGDPCFGSTEEYKVCVQKGCVDGGWSSWTSWTKCSVTCDGGLRSRARNCDSPSPSIYGHPCEGPAVEYVTCNRDDCPDNSLSPHPCEGPAVEYVTCNSDDCPVQAVYFTIDTPVNSTSKANKLNFTNVVTNEGNGYNVTSGQFVATIPGMYHVSLTADGNALAGSLHPLCVIEHNGFDVASLHPHAGTTSTTSAYVQMKAGDVLATYCDGGTNFIDKGSSSVFSGALVLKM